MLTRLLNVVLRLKFRLEHGFWCDCADKTPWVLVDTGRAKIRWCRGGCGAIDL
jgi:hypothetical protein